MIVIYTVVLNGHDNLRAPVYVERGARYICFSDDPMWEAPAPWEIRPCPTLGATANPKRDSRIPKILPHLWLPPHDLSVYHDASLVLAVPVKDFAVGDWVMFRHIARDCAYVEGRFCQNYEENGKRIPIGEPDLIDDQLERYRADGFPERFGLWCGGAIARANTQQNALLNEAWWREFMAGSSRDQLSFPRALWGCRRPITTLRGDILNNPAFRFNFHAAFERSGENPQYAQIRAAKRARMEWTRCPR